MAYILLAALADPMRQEILEKLRAGPCPVGKIAADMPISRPAVSQHLKVLKDAGLVVDRPAGNRRIYRLDPTGVEALRAQLDSFWNQALATYKALAEQTEEEIS